MPVDQVLHLKKRHSHFYPEVFYLLAAGYNTAVVVARYGNRYADQARPEETLPNIMRTMYFVTACSIR
jgi:hypothetical protein